MTQIYVRLQAQLCVVTETRNLQVQQAPTNRDGYIVQKFQTDYQTTKLVSFRLLHYQVSLDHWGNDENAAEEDDAAGLKYLSIMVRCLGRSGGCDPRIITGKGYTED